VCICQGLYIVPRPAWAPFCPYVQDPGEGVCNQMSTSIKICWFAESLPDHCHDSNHPIGSGAHGGLVTKCVEACTEDSVIDLA